MAVEPIKLRLDNAQFLGDVICATPALRDMAKRRRCTECLFEANVPNKDLEGPLDCPNCGRQTFDKKFLTKFYTGKGKKSFMAVFDENPYVVDYDGEPDMILKLGTNLGCKGSNTSGEHITQAFRKSILAKTGFEFPQGELRPDLHLSEYEKTMRPIEGRYWVICIGKRVPFTSKFWPPERWQAVIDALPEITFVQVGHSEHEHHELQGDNVINMIGKTEDGRTGIRDLFRLVYHSDGCCSLVSSLMHIAAAFKKPCVIPAGAREPVRFEQYAFHRYLHLQGSMECHGPSSDDIQRNHGGITSCWKASADACPNLEDGYPKCIMMISIGDVTNAIKSYYTGGLLEPVSERATMSSTKRPVCKLVCNAHAWGGGERSAAWLANRMLLEGYDVQVLPTGGVNDNFRSKTSPYVTIGDPSHPLTEPCDLMIAYTNDMTGKFQNDPRIALLEHVQAKRKIMVLNYRLQAAGKLDWTKTWDKYIFLCSDMETAFRERVPECSSVVLPPPVDLKPFLDTNFGSLNRTLHIVRVGSQSSQKIPKNIRQVVERIKGVHPSASFTFMGGHESLKGLDYVDQFEEYSKSVMDILRKGTVFWYMLPEGYLDNGPRVIMEAMAAGLPVIADNRGGAKDRIAPGTGWLCDTVEDHITVIGDITGPLLAQSGKRAREHAKANFDPEKWINAILE